MKIINLTIKELYIYCDNNNIKLNNVTNKKSIINRIIYHVYFNKLKKKITKKHLYNNRIMKEINSFNNIEYGNMMYNNNLNKIFFEKKKITIDIPKEFPFVSPIINGIITYNDSNWSPGKTLNELFTEYINTIAYFNEDDIKKLNSRIDNNNSNIDKKSVENINDITDRPNKKIIDNKINQIKTILKTDNIEYTENIDNYYGNTYINYKKNLFSKNKKLGEEKILFHGTDKDNITSIIENDFSLTNRTIHGSVYGKGIYFTNDINLACKYSEKYNNVKYIFLCYVYVGNIINGKEYPDMLPKIENTNSYYDTAVDNIINPIQYIKKKNHQYNILGYIKITLKQKYIENINIKQNRLNNRKLYDNIKLIFINKTSEEIFIYEDILKCSNNFYNCMKVNNISKFKFINEINKNDTYQFLSDNKKIYVCGYHDKEGKFNILNYCKINAYLKINRFKIDILN